MAERNCPVCGRNHYGLCHKCPHIGERKWRHKRWEETPCAACRLAEDGRAAGHGRGLSLEHVPERELLDAAPGPGRDAERTVPLFLATDPREVVARMRRFVRAILIATLDELQWIQDAIRRKSLDEVAARDGITRKQAAARRARAMKMIGWEYDRRADEWRWCGGTGDSGPLSETPDESDD